MMAAGRGGAIQSMKLCRRSSGSQPMKRRGGGAGRGGACRTHFCSKRDDLVPGASPSQHGKRKSRKPNIQISILRGKNFALEWKSTCAIFGGLSRDCLGIVVRIFATVSPPRTKIERGRHPNRDRAPGSREFCLLPCALTFPRSETAWRRRRVRVWPGRPGGPCHRQVAEPWGGAGRAAGRRGGAGSEPEGSRCIQ